MPRFVKQNPETQAVTPATMQAMAAAVSDTDEIASTGKLVVLITTVNSGGGQRYGLLAPFGDDVVTALHNADAAFVVLEPARFEALVAELEGNFDEGGLLDVEIQAFQFGSTYAFYETI